MPFGIKDCKKMEVVPGTGKQLLASPSPRKPTTPDLRTAVTIAIHTPLSASGDGYPHRTYTLSVLCFHHDATRIGGNEMQQ